MKIAKHLVEGLKMVALFGAIALVVWSMPEYEGLHTENSAAAAKSPITSTTVLKK
jgi:hypothetical protein